MPLRRTLGALEERPFRLLWLVALIWPLRAVAIGIAAAASFEFPPLGLALAGPATDVVGTDATLAIAAVLAAGARLAVLPLPSARAMRKEPSVPADPAAART